MEPVIHSADRARVENDEAVAETVDEHGAPSPSERHAVARVLTFSVLLGALTATTLLWCPLMHRPVIHPLAPQPVAFLVLVTLFAVVNLAPLPVRLRGEVSFVVLAEIPLLLGLVTVMPRTLVVSCVIADAIVYGLIRASDFHKLAFNLASTGTAAMVAAVVYRSVLGTHGVVGSVGWAAAAAGLMAATVFDRLAFALALRIYGPNPQERSAPDSARMVAALILFTSVALAIVVLDTAMLDLLAVVPLVVVGMLIIFAYRRYLGLTDKFGALQQLYEFSRSVGGMSLETSTTGWEILERVLVVMRTLRAELILIDGRHSVQRLVLGEDGQRIASQVKMDARSLAARAFANGRPALESGRSTPRGRDLVHDSVLGDFSDAVVAPIVSAEGVIGVLAALDRTPGFEDLNEDDLRLFEALAAHASTTLERARLVEELRLEAEAKSHQATHDALTGLPNRTLFLDSATASLVATGRAAIALLDLDRFKEVNDTLGHAIGDRLLCEIAIRLVKVASGRATVARLGGDEFALVIPGVIGPEEATGIVRDIETAISRPVQVDGVTLAVTASAGVSLAPEHGDNVATLLQRADIAMYHAKARRSGIEMYSAAHDSSMQRKLLLGGQLTEALSSRTQLTLVYQPIAKLSTGEIVRVEALTRWFHPEHGQIPPDEFIAIAEQMGLIGKITDFVLAEGCGQLAAWRAAGHRLGLAINLSGQDASDRAIVDKIAEHLSRFGLPPSSLSVEITETEVMADLREASGVLAELAELGVRIAVDDYGTGYSSLSYLHSLPLNELKLDRSFVGNIAANESNAIIVRSSVAMAHALGLSVVAEGAEDEVTCAMLAEAGCDSVQGYYLSRPRTADDLASWLESDPKLQFAQLVPAKPLRLIPGRLEELA